MILTWAMQLTVELLVCLLFEGRHFCLKCHITAAEAKISPADRRSKAALRSLETLEDDLERFSNAGGTIDDAKLYDNVIAPAFFDILLDQVKL